MTPDENTGLVLNYDPEQPESWNAPRANDLKRFYDADGRDMWRCIGFGSV